MFFLGKMIGGAAASQNQWASRSWFEFLAESDQMTLKVGIHSFPA